MRVVVQNMLKNQRTVAYEGQAGFRIGRDKACAVCLESTAAVTRIQPVHAEVERGSGGWELRVLPGAAPLVVDQQKVPAGSAVVLRHGSEVRIEQFLVTLDMQGEGPVSETPGAADVNRVQQELHTAVVRQLDLRRQGSSLQANQGTLEQINAIIDELINTEFNDQLFGNAAVTERLLLMDTRIRLVAKLASADRVADDEAPREDLPGVNKGLEELADGFVMRLARTLGLSLDADALQRDMETVDERFEQVAPPALAELPKNVRTYLVSRYLKKVLNDMIFGLGPLQDLLDTPNISEIMIISPELVYVERSGQVVESDSKFLGDEALLNVIERIVAPLGRRIDRSSPLVDARLSDGSRVNAVIPPIALKGPCLTIRRFPKHRVTIESLVKWRSLPRGAVALLDAAVKMPKNILVAGGTGSGKTTMLNALSVMIPHDDRIVTIEDAAELQLQQEHVVSLETKPPNVEGKGAYTIRDLVKNSLRMRPDRIVVGECRGEEAFDMLQAMNTGHDGSMTTIHSNSAADAISRVETMVLMAADLPLAAVRRQIAQAIDIIVFVGRLKGGRRMTLQITEVIGQHPRTGEVETRDIFAKVGEGKEAELVPTGYMPSFLGEAVERGLLEPGVWVGIEEGAA